MIIALSQKFSCTQSKSNCLLTTPNSKQSQKQSTKSEEHHALQQKWHSLLYFTETLVVAVDHLGSLLASPFGKMKMYHLNPLSHRICIGSPKTCGKSNCSPIETGLQWKSHEQSGNYINIAASVVISTLLEKSYISSSIHSRTSPISSKMAWSGFFTE